MLGRDCGGGACFVETVAEYEAKLLVAGTGGVWELSNWGTALEAN